MGLAPVADSEDDSELEKVPPPIPITTAAEAIGLLLKFHEEQGLQVL